MLQLNVTHHFWTCLIFVNPLLFFKLRGKDRQKLFAQSEEGKKMNILLMEPTCYKICKLCVFKNRNEHVFFSLFLRHEGTNYSTHQRVLSFTVWLFIVLLSSAIFYGQDQDSVS